MDSSLRDRREIRLALVLNGGVSLAIWIGGVVAEIDRARRAGLLADEGVADEGERVYRALLDLTDTVLRTDVIAGASAGGLNGCLLAAAIANHDTVADVRDTWIELGSFRKMLRSGLEAEPPSVLKGDSYFLPRLVDEFTARCSPKAVRDRLALDGKIRARIGPAERVRLLVTGTDLVGEPHVHTDDFGGALHDREHRALFVVDHDVERGVSTFAQDDAPRRLARIARSTASFPGAFEASFCRVTDPPGDEAAELKERDPNLHGIATTTTSRWVADGGILDNAPFRPALAAIAKARARGPVRRVLCYVTPYGAPSDEDPVTREQDPGVTSVVGAAFELPRSLAMTETLKELADYRRRVEFRREGRLTLAERLGAELGTYAGLVFDLYCNQRASASVDDVLTRLCGVPPYPAGEWARTHLRPRVSAELLQGANVELPWLPQVPEGAPQPSTLNLLLCRDDIWPFGLVPILRSARLVLDVLSRTLAITPPPPIGTEDPAAEAREAVFHARERLSNVIDWVDTMSAKYLAKAAEDYEKKSDYAPDELVALNGGSPLALAGIEGEARRQLVFLLLACAAYREIVKPEECVKHMRAVVKALGEGGPEAVVLLDGSELAAVRRAELRRELAILLHGRLPGTARSIDDEETCPGGTAPKPLAEQRRDRLLRIEIAYEAMSPTRGEHDQRIDLLRINAEAPCALDGRNLPERKLTGLGLAHFAAFYKRSWRANDWMWGRLDGARRLADLLVDPELLRLRLDAVPEEQRPAELVRVRDELVAIARPEGASGQYLERRFEQARGGSLEDVLLAELEALAEWKLDSTPPPSLEACRFAVAARIQLPIVAEELPVVRRAALEDVDEGSSPDAEGATWAARHGSETLTGPKELVAALRKLKLAEEESFAGEAGSNLLTRNVATTAAVAASAMSSQRSGLPRPARVVGRSLRGLLLAVYGLAWSLTSRRPWVKTLAALALVAAAVLVGLGLYADAETRSGNETSSPPAWLAIPARGVVAAALLLGILRAGKAGIVVAIGFVVAYVLVVLWPWPGSWQEGFERFWETSSVATLVVVLALLGVVAGLMVNRGPFRRKPT